MFLIRDVLDTQLVDREGAKIGKVDGVVIEVRDGSPPRIAHLEVGMAVLIHRLPRTLGRWIVRGARRLGIRSRRPYRIPWSKVIEVDLDVKVDLLADETPLLDWEKWLRRRVIGRIPGA